MSNRIREALHCIPADDRDTWLRMGMAVKSELGEEGFGLWDEWSQSASNYNKRDARDVWKSITLDGGITIGTLFHEAQKNGWRDDGTYQKPTPEEIAERKRKAAERAAKEDDKIARERAKTKANAAAIWKASTEARPNHPYLARKQIPAVATLREIDASAAAKILGYEPRSGDALLCGRLLVVPVKQGEGISTLELIDGDGRKAALAGRGSKAGGYWASQRLPDGDSAGLRLLVGEGVATVLSASLASECPAIAALSSGNLPAVARAMRARYPAALVILADLVKESGQPDPHAVQAARETGALLAVPDFGANRPENATDFNDLHQHAGKEAVKRCIDAAKPVQAEDKQETGKQSAPAPQTDGTGWPAPQPMSAKIEPEPYPLDALPETIRAAVKEVQAIVQAPVALVASSALATLSLAVQAHADVKRMEGLQGPISLFLLSIAEPNERKTTCDRKFPKPIDDYQAEQAEAMKPAIEEYRAELAAWEAKHDGILSAVKESAKKGKQTGELEASLQHLEHEKPKPPRVPRMILGDATPEALAWSLAKEWPSAGVLSNEAGVVFGSHGMSKDSVMRNLAQLNVLWDGGTHSIGRRTSESFTVRGARLTMGLMVQEAALREFFRRDGGLARGTGFLARFLVAWPQTSQGQRTVLDKPKPPKVWPCLSAFQQRIKAILNQPVAMDDEGALSPHLLELSQEAWGAWAEFHDAVETELRSGGEFCDVRDVAGKAADNAARLAALFHVFEHGTGGSVGLDSIDRASQIVAWHLNEARRFFGELALPVELADAARLDSWLIEHCRQERTHMVSKRYARQYGTLRDGARLDAAIRELAELDRLQLKQDGRQLTIYVNPALLEVTP